MSKDVVEFDVRELNEPPFQPIMEELEDLDQNQSLLLINSFEPQPLYEVLESRGYKFETKKVSPDEWRISIYRD